MARAVSFLGSAEQRWRRVAVVVWAVVLLGIFNCGVSHEEHIRMAKAYRQGTVWQEGNSALTLLRGHLADEYDLRRYYAYTNALLGRPYYSYYARPWADWQREFAAGQPAPDDDGPLRTPAAPLAGVGLGTALAGAAVPVLGGLVVAGLVGVGALRRDE